MPAGGAPLEPGARGPAAAAVVGTRHRGLRLLSGHRRWLALTVVVALGTGCATAYQTVPLVADPDRPPAAGLTRVCVMRPDPLDRGDRIAVRDDGRLVGTLVGGAFLCWDRPAADFQLTAAAENTARLHVGGAGGNVYVEVVPLLGALRVRCRLEVRPPAQAARCLPRCAPPAFRPDAPASP